LHWVLQRQPGSLPAWHLLSLCQLQQAEAMEDTPENAEARHKAFSKARQSLEQILAMDTTHWVARANRAYTLNFLESPEAMNTAFAQWESESQGAIKAIALYYWGKTLERLGQTDAAQAKLVVAQRLHPDIEARMQTSPEAGRE
jgi:hypothetical protein